MTGLSDGQLAFDFDELAREDARALLPEWEGAPLHFTTDYYPPAALDAAFEHWCFLNTHFDSYRRSHMWHRGIAHDRRTELAEHSGEMFTAELRPGSEQLGPGGLLSQMICEPCQWSAIGLDANLTVEAWHDHALPGWRDLPVVPRQIRVRTEGGLTKLAKAWIVEHYPRHMQIPGAPIVTERSEGATRHVPSYSLWGGYDLSATALARPPVGASAPRSRRSAPSFESLLAPKTPPRTPPTIVD